MSRATRPGRTLTGAALLLAVAATCGAAITPEVSAFATLPLHTDGVVLDAAGDPVPVPVGGDVQDDPERRLAQDAWLASGTVPGPDAYAALAERALRDLDLLVLADGAALAGVSARWRYVWPRDASFTAVALTRTGHPDDALRVLDYLRRMQDETSTDGVFAARYLPDGSGDVPDGRGPQLDGNGWVLWAVAEWYAGARPGGARDAALAGLSPLVERSVDAIRAQVDPRTGLPGVYADYWEVREQVPTLGTLAPLLLGARAIGPVLDALGLDPVDDVVRLLEAGQREFAPDYPRRHGGATTDTAVAFLMPPFAPLDPQVQAAWLAAAPTMTRSGGGLAPGSDWKPDGISWTPSTAVFALTAAASGDVDQATDRLDWLAEHTTPRGSLPEKVLWDGSPASAAPLAWTASLVLLTLDELDRQGAG
ncbi:glycoside hydrolase family 15 [Actinotalea sp.]|uniref:glycoside hydrolase family 15 n=1 Tax=Actinotalea sp. TaxID=1872145 RepID=UPI002C20E1BB|nr:glycoside hydrolase family 15 [Actinotalea sp.]HRA50328.1 glycoside hydrolase family 15 [Actinotalea sp.]